MFSRKLALFDEWNSLAVYVSMDNTVVIEDISKWNINSLVTYLVFIWLVNFLNVFKYEQNTFGPSLLVPRVRKGIKEMQAQVWGAQSDVSFWRPT